jgi:hypothetical protein
MFWQLLAESVIVQALLTLLIAATICYLYATNKSVPQELWYAFTLILGYYFGSKIQQTITNLRRQ